MSRTTSSFTAYVLSAALVVSIGCGISLAQNPKAKAKSNDKASPKTKLETKAKGPVYATPEEAEKDPQFAFQGEYKGEIKMKDADYSGDRQTVGVQVIARGNGKYHAVLYYGGLPGEGWKQGDKKEEAEETEEKTDSKTVIVPGTAKSSEKGDKAPDANKQQEPLPQGQLQFETRNGYFKFKNFNIRFGAPAARSHIQPDGVILHVMSDKQISNLQRVTRKSPTLGLKPAKGAIVLFDGSSTDAFQDGTKMTDDKLLMPEAITKQEFQSFTLHAEFRTPFQPEDGNEPKTAQHRGNSGIYLQNRYEIQILDSFGLEPKNDYCGGFYKFHTPKLNMCFPPLSWQTYDIDFTAAKYENGKKVKNARLTAKLNGVVIHDDIELVSETAGSLLKEGPEPGGLLFQQHGNPVRFKNIWLVEKN